ncbi:S1/P1 nuclease [Paucibacter sp. DJ2R-2]|uniref:S1/P1 nuclease n=1 Tax=Paucibacter sp. DJ2R-2 TaxID=2893558 RepID=UPI0021E46985|nr:S1/P1 nuclease [Paucibacter sp. DJ2R-2]MCV2419298.1 S1/P1 nuclease [Paucibacter sp. DJ4R-1]MCV2437798.1 S1/P1 nuclease [Paucibacter sp. DJ2R-2]
MQIAFRPHASLASSAPSASPLSRFRPLALLAGLALAAPLLLSSAPAQAWGAEGHRLVASVAEQGLSPAARAEVQRLLALEPGSTLASISTWADEHRSPQTGPWHYVNFPRDGGCSFEPTRDCEDGACVVGAIERQVEVLKNARATDEARLKALKYVVHLVADVHQPLHAGFADDRGGNSYQVQGFGRGSNLHSLWDSGLMRNRAGGAEALQQELSAGQGSQRMPAAESRAAALWAGESCRLVAAPGFYPDGHKVDQSYADAHEPALRQRLSEAARRLAGVLNSSLQ